MALPQRSIPHRHELCQLDLSAEQAVYGSFARRGTGNHVDARWNSLNVVVDQKVLL